MENGNCENFALVTRVKKAIEHVRSTTTCLCNHNHCRSLQIMLGSIEPIKIICAINKLKRIPKYKLENNFLIVTDNFYLQYGMTSSRWFFIILLFHFFIFQNHSEGTSSDYKRKFSKFSCQKYPCP